MKLDRNPAVQKKAADADRLAMIELGKQHATAEALFAYLKTQTNGKILLKIC
jgi:hypothetical protein